LIDGDGSTLLKLQGPLGAVVLLEVGGDAHGHPADCSDGLGVELEVKEVVSDNDGRGLDVIYDMARPGVTHDVLKLNMVTGNKDNLA
jgi:hypothetical protein